MTDSLAPAERYLFAAFDDGAVVLDLLGGTFFRLNHSAGRICQAYFEGQPSDAIARELALTFGIEPAPARQQVDSILARLASPLPAESSNPIVFRPDGNAHVLHCNGRPIWHVSADGRRLRYLAETAETDGRTQLLWVAPHLLRLRNRLVLHASAVERQGQVLAFCGSSGRGKSTLAGRLAAHGMTHVSDDLVILAFEADLPMVVRNGESVLRAWAEEQASGLRPSAEVPTDLLDRSFDGPRFPLGKVLFLDRDEAGPPEIEEQPLGRAEALVRMLENSFAELDRPDLWRQLWEENRRLVASVPMARAVIPDGLELLEIAVSDYARR